MDTVSRYLESTVGTLCSILDNIQKLVEGINKVMSGEKPMNSNEFVTFIHKIQDVTTFYSFEEESKT